MKNTKSTAKSRDMDDENKEQKLERSLYHARQKELDFQIEKEAFKTEKDASYSKIARMWADSATLQLELDEREDKIKAKMAQLNEATTFLARDIIAFRLDEETFQATSDEEATFLARDIIAFEQEKKPFHAGNKQIIDAETEKIRSHYQQEYQGLVEHIEKLETRLERHAQSQFVEEQKQAETYNTSLSDEIITLNVGGKLMQASRKVLCSQPTSMLAVLFSGRHATTITARDPNGNYFLDRDPSIFKHVLNYLRGYNLVPTLYDTTNSTKLELILDEFDYFCMPQIHPKEGYRIYTYGLPNHTGNPSIKIKPCFGKEGLLMFGNRLDPLSTIGFFEIIQPKDRCLLGSIKLHIPFVEFTKSRFISHDNCCFGSYEHNGTSMQFITSYSSELKKLDSYSHGLIPEFNQGLGGYQFGWILKKWPIPTTDQCTHFISAIYFIKKPSSKPEATTRSPPFLVTSDNITVIGYNMIFDGSFVYNLHTSAVICRLSLSISKNNQSFIWFPYVFDFAFNGPGFLIAKLTPNANPDQGNKIIILSLPYLCEAVLESPLYLAFNPIDSPSEITLFKMDPDRPKFLSFKPRQTKERPIITGHYLVQWTGESNLYEIIDLDYLFSK